MTPAFSVYLDLVRVLAAVIVLLNHYMPYLFGLDESLFPGHDAVVVFFVMSGYVIAFVADERERSPAQYALARLARLWSVAIPALAVAGIAALAVGSRQVASPAPGVASLPEFMWKGVVNVLFLGETWWGDISSPYNAPMWSLNYEGWYYAIFGSWIFLRGRVRTIAVIALCLLAGPKVMALMPCWLLGVVLYYQRKHLIVRSSLAYCLFGLSLVLYGGAYGVELTRISRSWLSWVTEGESYHLGPSTSVIGDLLLAPIVAMNFVAAANIRALGAVLLRRKRPIANAASYTLSIYLYHMPLFVIVYGTLGLGRSDGADALMTLAGVGLLIVALGRLTEHRRTAWRAWLARLAGARPGAAPAGPATPAL